MPVWQNVRASQMAEGAVGCSRRRRPISGPADGVGRWHDEHAMSRAPGQLAPLTPDGEPVLVGLLMCGLAGVGCGDDCA
jgi:hypothetical protein